MEAGESSARPSGTQTAGSLDHLDRRPRERIDTTTTYREIPSMATAALVSPSGPYHHQHHAHASYAGYPHSAPPTGIPAMISPAESRRASDDTEGPHRQSLPSISEVIGNKGAAFPPPPQPGLPSNQGLPSPFAASAPPRAFGDVGSDKNPSPRTLHPAPGYPRHDPLPSFSDPSRPAALSNRPAPPPLNTFAGRHPSPSVKQEHEMDPRHAEYSAGHQHTPSHQSHPSSGLYTPGSRPPPGQLPLPPFPVSPRSHAHALPSPFNPQWPQGFSDERHHSLSQEDEYGSTLDKAFETWGYAEGLSTIAHSARTILHFAEAYSAVAREQQGSPPIPSRLPTDNETNHMVSTGLHMVEKLKEVLEIVHQSRMSVELRARERESSGGRRPGEEGDMAMGGDPSRQPYPPNHLGGDVKKRRGRAAPPGRCHSCNRIDTPEWRRGPDGARTLCNACGLHYAKLERRRQLDRSGRPKTAEERGQPL